jgi:folate-binding protein YgfZ
MKVIKKLSRFLRVTGPDAERFLHAVLPSNVKRLAAAGDFAAAQSSLLDIKGHLIADASLLRLRGDFFIASESESFESLKAGLEKVHISEDLSFEETKLWREETYLSLEPPALEELGKAQGMSRDRIFRAREHTWGIELALTRFAVPLREMWISAGEKAPTEWEILSPETFQRERIEKSLPLRGCDYSAESLAVDLPLHEAISLTKGCYLGQEVVAKATQRGKPPRIFVKVESEAPLAPRTLLVDKAGESIGEISSSSERIALGFLRRFALEQGLEVYAAGQRVQYQALSAW